MKYINLRTIAFTLIAFVASWPAVALPIHATFSGTVTGGVGFSSQVLTQFPLGTAASFNVTFDDAGLVSNMPITDLDLAPVSGTVQLGGLQWALDAGSITQYSFSFAPGSPVLSYGLQLTGSGPSVSGGAGSLFGLFLRITRR
jgi:hypothetical protein